MSKEVFKKVLNAVNNEMKLPVTPKALEIILCSNGYAYANIVLYGIDNKKVKLSIRDAIANQYMNRPYPLNISKNLSTVKGFESELIKEIRKINKYQT